MPRRSSTLSGDCSLSLCKSSSCRRRRPDRKLTLFSFQILAAVGLLLAGVLGLVGQLLNGLGLGGLVNGLLGGLGIDKLLGGLGLGGMFGGDDKKKGKKSGGGMSSLPLIGGLMGGGK